MSNMPALSKDPHSTDEAEQTLHAIREGAVDAFVIEELEGHHVYTLQGADLPYSILVERMQQPAAMLNGAGEIVYCNDSLASLLRMPREQLVSSPLQQFVDPAQGAVYEKLRIEAKDTAAACELRLRRSDGVVIPASIYATLLSRRQSAMGVLITDLTLQYEQMELAERLQVLQDEERRRIARDLHDSIGQLLVAVSMNNATAAADPSKLGPAGAQALRENDELLQEITNQVRTISHLLHPPLLDEVGLSSALRWLVDGFSNRSNIQTSLEIARDFPRVPPAVEIALFRVVQECLSNVHRHSHSDRCAINLSRQGSQVHVEIKDWGRGIPAEKLEVLSSSGGVGVRGLQERLRRLGGTLEITSNSAGTTVTATVPL